jgi:hypothetical protein
MTLAAGELALPAQAPRFIVQASRAEARATQGVILAERAEAVLARQMGKPVVRQQYESEVLALTDLASSLRNMGKSSEEVARLVYAERNLLKVKYRDLTPPDLLRKFEQDQIQRWGNPFGPTIEQLRAKGMTWEEIIESAARPGGGRYGF